MRTFRGGSSKKALAGLIRTVAEARDRKRNTILYWASCRAIERGAIDQIEDELIAAVVAPDFPESEARLWA